MWPYWAMFLIPAFGAIVEPGPRRSVRQTRYSQLQWLAAGAAVALVVGFRSKVGGDWANYDAMLEDSAGMTLWEALRSTDPGFGLLNWISLQMDWGQVGVNMMTAPLFAFALARFCRTLPRPWLALAISIPYLVIVVAMGYTRQGVALACGMLGLLALGRRALGTFVAWILLGAAFHKTAILLLPMAALVKNRNVFLKIIYGSAILVVAYFVVLSDAASELYESYVLADYQSEGALIRLAMNAVPAVIFLWKWREFTFKDAEASLWRWFSWLSLLLLVALAATHASTAVDRVGLYLLPLQLVVFSHLPEVVSHTARGRNLCVGAVVSYYGLVLFTWLNFATHALYWLPYRFFPFELVQ